MVKTSIYDVQPEVHVFRTKHPHTLGPPTLLCTKKAILPHQNAKNINMQIERSLRKKIISTSIIKKWNSLVVDRT